MPCSKRGAGLSRDSRPGPGGDGRRYLCCSAEAARGGLLLLCPGLPCIWQRVSAVRAEGPRERAENTAQLCAPQAGTAPGWPGDGARLPEGQPQPCSVLSLGLSTGAGKGWGQAGHRHRPCGPALPLTVLQRLQLLRLFRLLCRGSCRALVGFAPKHLEQAVCSARHAAV